MSSFGIKPVIVEMHFQNVIKNLLEFQQSLNSDKTKRL